MNIDNRKISSLSLDAQCTLEEAWEDSFDTYMAGMAQDRDFNPGDLTVTEFNALMWAIGATRETRLAVQNVGSGRAKRVVKDAVRKYRESFGGL